MTDDGRPDPDSLLDIVRDQEEKNRRGKLTVFMGYSAGVGKTYAMLEAAQAQIAKGTDLVIGVVMSHGRKETEKLAEGIEIMEPLKVRYRDIELEELDLDGMLRRRPQIALIDELAHTNMPNSRNIKRYQDVLELLNAGIDVYSTLNIQHIESMNDLVEEITGVRVRETVPDTVLNDADFIKLVDITPDDLMTRFREGKIYIPEQAKCALDNFFNEGNLIALREMSFRIAAEHTDEKMSEYLKSIAKKPQFIIKEKLLVCIGDSEKVNETLIHAGKRYADVMKSEWDVLYVERHKGRDCETISEAAVKGLELAKTLGADTDTSYGVSVEDEILEYAHSNEITQVIVGNPLINGKARRNRLVERLSAADASFSLILVNVPQDAPEETATDQYDEEGNLIDDRIHISKTWKHLIIGAAVALVCLILNLKVVQMGTTWWSFAMMLSLLATVICATRMSPFPAGFTALLNAMMIDFFFMPPYSSLKLTDPAHVASLVAFVFIGVIVSITSNYTNDRYAVEKRKYRLISTQYSLSSELVAAGSLEEAFKAMESHLRKDYDVLSAYYIPHDNNLRMVRVSEGFVITSKEIITSKWVYNNGVPAGMYTDTLSSAEMKYYPMKVRGMTLGVVGVRLENQDKSLRLEQEKIVQTFIDEVALAVDRIMKIRDSKTEIPEPGHID